MVVLISYDWIISIKYVFVSRNESDEGEDPEKKKFQNQLSGL